MTSFERPGADANRAALLSLLLVVFINIAGFGIVIPLLPFYAQSFHVQAWQVTVLFSAYSVGQFIGEPLWGRLSDRMGRRPVLIGTVAATALGYLALAFAPNIWVALALRLFGGVVAGNTSTIQSYVADITPWDKRVARLGLIGAAFGLGFVVGPSLGGLLARPELGSAGFRPPLLVAAGLSGLATLGLFVFVRESRSAHTRSLGVVVGRFAALHDARNHPVIGRVLLTTMAATGAFSAMEAVFGLWGEARFGWGPRDVGLIFALIGTISATSQGLLAGRAARRFGEGPTLVAGLAATSLSLFIQAMAPNGWVALASIPITAIGFSITQPSTAGLISHSSKPERQGAMLGLNGAAGALARIVGPIIAGPLFSRFGPSAPFWFSAVMLAPAVILATRAASAVRQLKTPA